MAGQIDWDIYLKNRGARDVLDTVATLAQAEWHEKTAAEQAVLTPVLTAAADALPGADRYDDRSKIPVERVFQSVTASADQQVADKVDWFKSLSTLEPEFNAALQKSADAQDALQSEAEYIRARAYISGARVLASLVDPALVKALDRRLADVETYKSKLFDGARGVDLESVEVARGIFSRVTAKEPFDALVEWSDTVLRAADAGEFDEQRLRNVISKHAREIAFTAASNGVRRLDAMPSEMSEMAPHQAIERLASAYEELRYGLDWNVYRELNSRDAADAEKLQPLYDLEKAANSHFATSKVFQLFSETLKTGSVTYAPQMLALEMVATRHKELAHTYAIQTVDQIALRQAAQDRATKHRSKSASEGRREPPRDIDVRSIDRRDAAEDTHSTGITR